MRKQIHDVFLLVIAAIWCLSVDKLYRAAHISIWWPSETSSSIHQSPNASSGFGNNKSRHSLIKSENGGILHTSQSHRRQLEEIPYFIAKTPLKSHTTQDQLDATKGIVIPFHPSGNKLDLVEQRPVQHTYFYFPLTPPFPSIPSINNTSQLFHLSLFALLALTRLMSTFAASSPMPMPAKECNVIPPILQAAMPVEAVMYTLLDPLIRCSIDTIFRSTKDLPVPASPVKNTFYTIRRQKDSIRIPACSTGRSFAARETDTWDPPQPTLEACHLWID